MRRAIFDKNINELANNYLDRIEKHFDSDVIFFYGQIYPNADSYFRSFIEELKDRCDKNRKRLAILLNTIGGVVETVEKLVEIIRFHYDEVYFIVPNEALSAGTVFCMSGNKIFMDYTSSLGPIDPQVYSDGKWIPALGYLDQVQTMIEKSQDEKLSQAELALLGSIDLALLNQFEQARELTITLLKKWLVQYKFSNWKKHATTPGKTGKKVTPKEKEKRAEEIAEILSNNKIWHSHGRKIGIDTLTSPPLKIKIDDYSGEKKLRQLIRDYSEFITQYIERHKYPFFLHSKFYF